MTADAGKRLAIGVGVGIIVGLLLDVVGAGVAIGAALGLLWGSDRNGRAPPRRLRL